MKCSWSAAGKIECFENNPKDNTPLRIYIKKQATSDEFYMKVVYAFLATFGMLTLLMLFAIALDNWWMSSQKLAYNPTPPSTAYKGY